MKKNELIECLLTCLVLLMGLLSIKSLILILPFSLYYLATTGKMPALSPHSLVIIACTLLYVSVGLLTTTYIPNSFSISIDYLILLVVFLMSSASICQAQNLRHVLCVLFCSIVSFVTIITLLFYMMHQADFVSLGFSDMTEFKHYYRPLFMLCNDNATLVLCLLPFTLLITMQSDRSLRYWSLINMSLVNLCLMLSYSRGIYISTLVFYLVVFVMSVIYRKNRKGLVSIGVSFTSMVLALSLSSVVRESVFTTVSFNKTESQKRSLDSRISKLETMVENNQNTFFGCGDGNYFISNLNNRTDFDSMVSASSNNGIMQLYVERGVLGIASLVALMMYIAIISIRRFVMGDFTTVVLACGVLVVAIRECTFASFTRVNAVMFLCFIMVVLLINKQCHEKQ